VAAAKGLSFSLGIPLIAIGTLELMAATVIRKYPGYETYVPMLDARRMEVYTQTFRADAVALDDPAPVVLDMDFFTTKPGASLVYFGDGASKSADFAGKRDIYLPDIYPLASQMVTLAGNRFSQGDFADLAYFEPAYLKEFVPGPKAG
jgi:tRNA threonylcarbamoyladenosine biosynthesis protein TsaB